MDVLPLAAVAAAARAIAGQAAIEAARIHRPARNAPVKDGCARPWARNSSVSGMSVVPFRLDCEVIGYIEAGPRPYFQQISAGIGSPPTFWPPRPSFRLPRPPAPRPRGRITTRAPPPGP